MKFWKTFSLSLFFSLFHYSLSIYLALSAFKSNLIFDEKWKKDSMLLLK